MSRRAAIRPPNGAWTCSCGRCLVRSPACANSHRASRGGHRRNRRVHEAHAWCRQVAGVACCALSMRLPAISVPRQPARIRRPSAERTRRALLRDLVQRCVGGVIGAGSRDRNDGSRLHHPIGRRGGEHLCGRFRGCHRRTELR